jgi:hypothetical protein
MTKTRNSRWDETGVVQWMLLMWFFIIAAASAVVIAVVMTVMDPDPDSALTILRAAGFPVVIVAIVGAKLITRKRYQKPPQASDRT